MTDSQDSVADALHEMNGALCEFSKRWNLDGDYLRCASCNRPHIASAIDRPFRHSDECDAEDSEASPWRYLLGILQPLIALQAQQGEAVAWRYRAPYGDGYSFASEQVMKDMADWLTPSALPPPSAGSAEPVAGEGAKELRLWDSQWVNIVNHDNCYRELSKEDAVHMAVKLTEKAMEKNYRESAFRAGATDPTHPSDDSTH